jgi:hypothetical protein
MAFIEVELFHDKKMNMSGDNRLPIKLIGTEF